MGICKLCKKESKEIADSLSLCRDCILENPEKALKIAKESHELSRMKFGLSKLSVLTQSKGLECNLCGNKCKIKKGEKGFCGLVENRNGKLEREKDLICSYYFDPLPTNCVSSWVCAASGKGYPKFSYSKGDEYGYKNLAVFCIGCNFDCLFCQNWHFKLDLARKPIVRDEEFLRVIDDKTSCICFFGGDPSPQLDKIVRICKLLQENFSTRILRFCLETNGNSNPKLLKKFAELAFSSGGTIKFDLKFWNETLNIAITGTSNKLSFKNFESLAGLHEKRREVPLLVASTLMIPGYVTLAEIKEIASFIASLNEDIPYALLAFYPEFEMKDLPFTSLDFALKAKKIAEKCGLRNVKIGNWHLLTSSTIL